MTMLLSFPADDHLRKKEKSNLLDSFLQSIAEKKYIISSLKRQILETEVEMKRFQLEITSQSLSLILKKDKQASLSYYCYEN